MKRYHILYLLLVDSLLCAGGNPPLMTAMDRKDIPEVTRLLKEGADPNERNNAGCSPLNFSFELENLFFTKLLLEYKADPNAVDDCHWVELDNAVAFGTKEQVLLLMEYGANPFQATEDHKNSVLCKTSNAKKNIELVLAEQIKQITTLLPFV